MTVLGSKLLVDIKRFLVVREFVRAGLGVVYILPQTVCIPRLVPRSRAAVRSSAAAGSSWPEE